MITLVIDIFFQPKTFGVITLHVIRIVAVPDCTLTPYDIMIAIGECFLYGIFSFAQVVRGSIFVYFLLFLCP